MNQNPKYLNLKKKLSQVIAENENLVDKLKRQKVKLKVLKAEKNLLLERLGDSHVVANPKSDAKPLNGITAEPAKNDFVIPQLGLIEDCSEDSEFKVEPTFPMQFGQIRLESLGEISLKPNFHTDRYIYPIGFTTVRSYPSMVNPNISVEYCSQIIDGGDAPLYRVTAQDDPNNPIIEKSATACWTAVIRQANKIRNKEHSNSASGPDYFAYSNPKILKMIQEMKGADQCVNYKMQKVDSAK